MKLKQFFSTKRSALWLALGTVSLGLAAGTFIAKSNQPEAVETHAEASNAESDFTFYFKVTFDAFYEADAMARVRLYQGDWGNPTWIEPNVVDETQHIYSFNWAAGKGVAQLFRVSPSFAPASDSDWPKSDIWTQSWDVWHDSGKNFLTLPGYDNDKIKYENYTFVDLYNAGEKIYLNVQNNWWGDDYTVGETTYESKTYLHAFGDKDIDLEMEKDDHANLYSAAIPSLSLIHGMLFVRGNGFDGSSYVSPAMINQSTNVLCYSGTHSVAVTLLDVAYPDSGDWGKVTCSFFGAKTDAYLSDAFAYQFLNTALCLDAGGLVEGAADNWTELGLAYASIYEELENKNYLKHYQTYTEGTTNNTNDMLIRYDTAVAKNSGTLNNFMGRSPITISNASSYFFGNEGQANQTALYVIAIVGFAVIAGAAFFFVRKRNH